ncbi:MAG: response regulator [Solirubrobacteraceae bacterium]
MLDLEPRSPLDTGTRPRHAAADETPQATTLLRLVVADDHPLYRQGIVRALDAYGGFLVVGEAADGVAALALIRELEPDVALLDVRMPILDGVDVVDALALHGPDVPVVLLSAFSDRQLVDSALQAGAAAYIDKTGDRDAICLQLATIAGSGRALSPRNLSPRDPLARPAGCWAPRLTRTEHELLQLAGKGTSKVAAAGLLGVGEAEIRRLGSSVMRKLDADSFQEAVVAARARRLIR